jgi:hypothetical protein
VFSDGEKIMKFVVNSWGSTMEGVKICLKELLPNAVLDMEFPKEKNKTQILKKGCPYGYHFGERHNLFEHCYVDCPEEIYQVCGEEAELLKVRPKPGFSISCPC